MRYTNSNASYKRWHKSKPPRMAGMHSKPENCHTKLDVVSMLAYRTAPQHA